MVIAFLWLGTMFPLFDNVSAMSRTRPTCLPVAPFKELAMEAINRSAEGCIRFASKWLTVELIACAPVF